MLCASFASCKVHTRTSPHPSPRPQKPLRGPSVPGTRIAAQHLPMQRDMIVARRTRGKWSATGFVIEALRLEV
jgi:hypothetical protein